MLSAGTEIFYPVRPRVAPRALPEDKTPTAVYGLAKGMGFDMTLMDSGQFAATSAFGTVILRTLPPKAA
jgi:hypothetical protein